MIKPLHKFVLIKKEEKENKTASGIVLTTEKKEVPSIASVIAVGDGRTGTGILLCTGKEEYQPARYCPDADTLYR